MAAQGSPGAVRAGLLDALGARLELCPPAPRLQAALRERAGLEVDEATAGRAIAAEIRYYRAHLHVGRTAGGLPRPPRREGGTADGLARLRSRCVDVMRHELGDAVPAGALLEALLAALEFRAFP